MKKPANATSFFGVFIIITLCGLKSYRQDKAPDYTSKVTHYTFGKTLPEQESQPLPSGYTLEEMTALEFP